MVTLNPAVGADCPTNADASSVVVLMDKLAAGLGGVTADEPPFPPLPPPHPATKEAAARQHKDRVITDIMQASPIILVGMPLHDNTMLLRYKCHDRGTGKDVTIDARTRRDLDNM